MYHGNPKGTGVAASVAKVDTTARAWTSPALDGELYGEPLVFDGRVYVATEHDTVYSLSAATGAVVWSNHVANPVPVIAAPVRRHQTDGGDHRDTGHRPVTR